MSALIASDLPRQVISFFLHPQEFALDLRMMQEVVLLPGYKPVPQAPEHVPGIIDMRGQMVTLIDLRRRLGLPPQPYTLRTAVLVCQSRGERWGLVVDEIADILEVPVDAWMHLPESLDAGRQRPLVGIARVDQHLLFVLDGTAVVEGAPVPPDHLLAGDSPLTAQAMPVWEAAAGGNLLTGGAGPAGQEAGRG